ncbi:S24 family peptidase [Cypionkella sinensis]|uniref:Helix-turn-helix transcriptional regulator n=1 Tax=Cypionkella sinensis TaxID=1756043 RepID=A0ABV7IUH8_9RHOB
MHAPISDKKAFVDELLARLRDRISLTRESEKEFAKRLGSSEALFKNLTSGSLPAADRLTVLLNEIGETLVLGAEVKKEPPAPAEQIKLDGVDYASIALHEASLSAGPGVVNGMPNVIDHLAFRRDWLKRLDVNPDMACLARVIGDSMFPTLSPNDMVLINTRHKEPPIRARGSKDKRRSSIYAFVQDGEARVKRIERPEPDLIILLSDNPDHPPETLTGARATSLQIIGKVVWWGHTNRE